MPPVANRPTEA